QRQEGHPLSQPEERQRQGGPGAPDRGNRAILRHPRQGRRSQQGHERRLYGHDQVPREREEDRAARCLWARERGDGLPGRRRLRPREERPVRDPEEHLANGEMRWPRRGAGKLHNAWAARRAAALRRALFVPLHRDSGLTGLSAPLPPRSGGEGEGVGGMQRISGSIKCPPPRLAQMRSPTLPTARKRSRGEGHLRRDRDLSTARISGATPCRNACVALLVAAALIAANAPVTAHERLAVVATTVDLKSLAEAVGGDHVPVTSLVPPGFDAEEYQPRPQDLARVKQAQAVVRVGLDFDLWFDRLLMQVGIPRGAPGYVDASYGITALEVRGQSVGPGDGHAHGNGNPHYWLDPRHAHLATANILDAFARIDPANAPVYEANRAAFLARIERKLADWQVQLTALNGVPLVAYHNSWPYLARRFRLDFIGTVEPKPGVPPSP